MALKDLSDQERSLFLKSRAAHSIKEFLLELRNEERRIAMATLTAGGSREEGIDAASAADTCEALYEAIFQEEMP